MSVRVFVKGSKCGSIRLMSASLSGEQLRNMRSYILKYFIAWWKGFVGHCRGMGSFLGIGPPDIVLGM